MVGDVAVWYWGHEHSLQFFKPYAGLKAGRLIGNGSVPTLLSQTVSARRPFACVRAPAAEISHATLCVRRAACGDRSPPRYHERRRRRHLRAASVVPRCSAQPYAPKAGLAAPNVDGITSLPQPVASSPQMSVAAFGTYYNCSFVIITLDGDKATAQTYDVPWLEADVKTGNKWGEPQLRYTEQF